MIGDYHSENAALTKNSSSLDLNSQDFYLWSKLKSEVIFDPVDTKIESGAIETTKGIDGRWPIARNKVWKIIWAYSVAHSVGLLSI